MMIFQYIDLLKATLVNLSELPAAQVLPWRTSGGQLVPNQKERHLKRVKLFVKVVLKMKGGEEEMYQSALWECDPWDQKERGWTRMEEWKIKRDQGGQTDTRRDRGPVGMVNLILTSVTDLSLFLLLLLPQALLSLVSSSLPPASITFFLLCPLAPCTCYASLTLSCLPHVLLRLILFAVVRETTANFTQGETRALVSIQQKTQSDDRAAISQPTAGTSVVYNRTALSPSARFVIRGYQDVEDEPLEPHFAFISNPTPSWRT